MNRFVPTTHRRSKEKRWINLDKVEVMRRVSGTEDGESIEYTVINFRENSSTLVLETPEELLSLGGA